MGEPFTVSNARSRQASGAQTKQDIGMLARAVVKRAIRKGDARIALEVCRELGSLRAAPRIDTGMTQAVSALLAGGAPRVAGADPSSQKPPEDGSNVNPVTQNFSLGDLESVGQLRFNFDAPALTGEVRDAPVVDARVPKKPYLNEAAVARIRNRHKEPDAE